MSAEPVPDVLFEALPDAVIVGGYVRDHLNGQLSHDVDLAVPYRPDETKARLEAAGIKTYPLGEKFGTVGAIVNGDIVEVTTFRSELYDGVSRKPQVTFTEELEEDLARRDFTINAMAMRRDGTVIDRFGGRKDLQHYQVRFVGNARDRILEDPLRMLRAVRMALKIKGKVIAPDRWIIERHAQEILRVSGERIRDELLKILSHPRRARGIRMLRDLGLLEHVLACVHRMQWVPQKNPHHFGTVWQHTISALASLPANTKPLTALAVLLHDVGKETTRARIAGMDTFYGHDHHGADALPDLLAHLKFSGTDMAFLQAMVRYHLQPCRYDATWSDRSVRRLQRRLNSAQQMRELLVVARADAHGHAPESRRASLYAIAGLQHRLRAVSTALDATQALLAPGTGHVVMDMGLTGPSVGKALRQLEDLVLAGELPLQPGADLVRRALEPA